MREKFRREGEFYVYIVECSDRTYYTGYTGDLKERLKEHNDGKRGAKYLRGKVPVKLVYAKEYKYYKNAVHAEIDIKKRTRREKITMIEVYQKNINPNFALAKFSQRAARLNPNGFKRARRGNPRRISIAKFGIKDAPKVFIRTFG